MRKPCTAILLGVLAFAMLVGCGSDALLGPGAPQGIAGLVLIGPQCPVQTEQDPCPDLPHQATIEVRLRGGALVTNVRSGSDGTFRVGLRPGVYTLRPEAGQPLPVASDLDVTVVAGNYSDVTIHYDTGIR